MDDLASVAADESALRSPFLPAAGRRSRAGIAGSCRGRTTVAVGPGDVDDVARREAARRADDPDGEEASALLAKDAGPPGR